MTRHQVASIQSLLYKFDPEIIIDGLLGNQTRSIYRRFMKAEISKYNTEYEHRLLRYNFNNLVDSPLGFKYYFSWSERNDEDHGKGRSSFFTGNYKKDLSVLHHAASDAPLMNMARFFSREDYATHFGIGRDGTLLAMAPIGFGAYHMNIRAQFNTHDKSEARKNHEFNMAMRSLGVEIMSLGALRFQNGKTYTKKKEQLVEIPIEHTERIEPVFRRYSHFHAYTNEQMTVLKYLLKWQVDEGYLKTNPYNRPSIEQYHLWFDYSMDAVMGTGLRNLFPHSSVRAKTDAYPSCKLLPVLQYIYDYSQAKNK